MKRTHAELRKATDAAALQSGDKHQLGKENNNNRNITSGGILHGIRLGTTSALNAQSVIYLSRLRRITIMMQHQKNTVESLMKRRETTTTTTTE